MESKVRIDCKRKISPLVCFKSLKVYVNSIWITSENSQILTLNPDNLRCWRFRTSNRNTKQQKRKLNYCKWCRGNKETKIDE